MNATVKKTLNISLKVVAGLLVAFTVLMMVFTIVSVTTVDKNDRSIFGIRFYIVLSGSMSLSENNKDMDVHFNEGDIVLAKKLEDTTTLQPGDIISFISANEKSWGQTITHMIAEVRTAADGTVIGYETFGTNTGEKDKALVQPEYVMGKYVGKLPYVGWFFDFVQTTPGYLLCILLPFLLLILYNGANVIRLFRKYKKEQTAIMDAEKAEIAAERKQNEDMLRELQALKAQLEQQSGAMPAAKAEEPEAPPQETTASEASEQPVEQPSQESEENT